jgi:hypothetical protein
MEAVPATAVAPAANLNVVAGEMIVFRFIALLKIALTTAPWQIPVEPPAGITETTVGGVVGEVGPPALSVSPHPTNAAASKNAGIQIMPTFDLHISFTQLQGVLSC